MKIKKSLIACSVAGTSGTLVACDLNGSPLGKALPYHMSYPDQESFIKGLNQNERSSISSNSRIARALHLVEKYGTKLILRHQADWIVGWLIGDWRYGEEGNNIRMGWNLSNASWLTELNNVAWREALPEIVPSGNYISNISHAIANSLGLSQKLCLIAGTTDSNAAVLAVNPQPEDGITILGSTIVLKRFVESPINEVGITNHRVNKKWLCGGASNTGGAVLQKFFNKSELKELSRQIDPESDSGIVLRPMISRGERFPINDPYLEPILEPRPISDSLFLHAMLEGLTLVELKGWEKLTNLGAPPPKRVITLGGGAQNPQWRRLREKALGIPVITMKTPPAKGVALLALGAVLCK